MRGIPRSVVGHFWSVALSVALVVMNLGAGVSVATADTSAGSQQVQSGPTIVREITAHRTATSDEYQLSNGLVRDEYYSDPVNYREATTSAWTPIDSTLATVTSAGATVAQNRANSFALKLPADLSTNPVSIETTQGKVSIRPSFVSKIGEAPVGSGALPLRSNSATDVAYANAFSGATLDYQSLSTGLKETIVLAKPTATSTFGFDVVLTGLTPRQEADGSISLVSLTTSATVFVIPAPFMTDSSAPQAQNDYSSAVHYVLSGSAPTWHLDVVADPTWLSDPARVYPVRIDPTVQTVSTTLVSNQDTFVSSNAKTTNYVTHTLIWVNSDDPGAYWTEYGEIQPSSAQISDMATKSANGTEVVSAYLKEALGSTNIANSGSVKGYMCTTSTAWNLGTMTWNSGAPSDLATCATPYVSTTSGWNNFDVTAMTAYWQTAGTPYQKATLQLQGTSQTDVGFNAADITSGSKPIWEIDYAHVPSVSLSSPTSATVMSNPSAQWAFSESLGNPQAEYQIEVATSTSSPAIATTDVASAATSSVLPAPSAGFVSGNVYYVHVRAASSPSTQVARLWSPWSSWGSFTAAPLPGAVATVSAASTASASWFAESDTNGDGLNDANDNTNTSGRGSVTLNWSPATNATGYNIYLSDGNAYRQIGSTTSTSWASAGKGIYPTDSQIASLSVNTTANPFPAGTGLDLRDDPRQLYTKTAGTTLDGLGAYVFRVVPYNGTGSLDVSSSVGATVTLQNRTLRVAGEPAHTDASLGALFHHSGSVHLESGALQLDVTDLSIKCIGPEASLSRHYASSNLTTSTYAPGWRFSFERNLVVGSNIATYTDAAGDTHRFVKVGSVWQPPNGLVATLTVSGSGSSILFKGQTTESFAATSGPVLSESDAHNNKVIYDRTTLPGHLYIRAANGQYIDVSLTGDGRVTQAQYATPDGIRTVSYDEGGGYSGLNPTTVHYYAGAGTTDDHRVRYYYGANGSTANRLVCMDAPDYGWYNGFRGGWETTYTAYLGYNFGYDTSSRLASWQLVNSFQQCGANTVSYSTGTATVTNPVGSSQTYTWNSDSSLNSKTVVGGSPAWTYQYGPTGAEIYESTPLGHTLSYALDARDNVLSTTDELGNTTCDTYDSQDRILTETDPRGAVTYNTYTGPDLTTVEKSLDASGTRSHVEYSCDASGAITEERQRVSTNTTAVTDYSNFSLSHDPQTTVQRGVLLAVGSSPQDLTSTKYYDSFGNLISETDASGRWVTQTNTYTISGLLASSMSVTGTVTNNTYNQLGSLWKQSTTDGTTTVNSQLWVRDGRGTPTDWVQYDDKGGLRATTQYTNDLAGRHNWAECSDDNGTDLGSIGWAYDAAGNVLASPPDAVPGGAPNIVTYTCAYYDAEGRQTSLQSPGDATFTVSSYSPAGLVTRIDRPDGSWSTFTYDSVGNQTSETHSTATGAATTSKTYDLGGRVIKSFDENGNETDYTYDLAGNQLTAGIGGQTGSSDVHNTLGQVLSHTDPDSIVTTTTYDAAGRALVSAVGGQQTTNVYDAAGRLSSTTDPSGACVTCTYDDFSRPILEQHFVGGVDVADIATTYDWASRVTGKTRSRGSAFTESVGYIAGVEASSTLGYGSTTSTVNFDISSGLEKSRVISGSDFASITSTTTRDTTNRVTDLAISPGANWHYSYDSANHITTQTGSALNSAATYSFGGDGHKSSENLPFAYGGSLAASYTYTADSRLATVVGSGAGNFGYDPSGDVTTFTATVDGSGTTTSGVLHYDGAGHLLNETGGTTPTGSVVTTFTFDASQGRRTAQGPLLSPNATVFGYDRAGKLSSFATSAAASASYSYDGLGQRTQSVVTSGSLTTTTTWTYDGIQLLALSAQRSDGTTWSIAYVYSSTTPYAGVYRASGASATVFGLATTDRGDVAELTDASGNAFAAYRYDEWGRPLSTNSQGAGSIPAALASDIANRQPLRYAGYVFDGESGLYYCSARYYDPATMQFITKDPARADGEQSAYQYCAGNPANNVDPSGRWLLAYKDEPYAWFLTHWKLGAWTMASIVGTVVTDALFPATALQEDAAEAGVNMAVWSAAEWLSKTAIGQVAGYVLSKVDPSPAVAYGLFPRSQFFRFYLWVDGNDIYFNVRAHSDHAGPIIRTTFNVRLVHVRTRVTLKDLMYWEKSGTR